MCTCLVPAIVIDSRNGGEGLGLIRGRENTWGALEGLPIVCLGLAQSAAVALVVDSDLVLEVASCNSGVRDDVRHFECFERSW